MKRDYKFFYDIEDSGWKGDEGTSLKQLYIGEYYRRLALHFSKENKFRLYFLKLNDEYIAGIYALIDHEILYLIKIDYSNDFHYYSPSMVLFYFLFEQLFEKKLYGKLIFMVLFKDIIKLLVKPQEKLIK